MDSKRGTVYKRSIQWDRSDRVSVIRYNNHASTPQEVRYRRKVAPARRGGRPCMGRRPFVVRGTKVCHPVKQHRSIAGERRVRIPDDDVTLHEVIMSVSNVVGLDLS